MSQDVALWRQAVPCLVEWYKANRVAMPWREDPTPYHVWISEIMLQQTRIEAAIPYYHRFLDALPDVRALAAVDDDRLMKLWQGLGYYSRARNLKKAAQEIVSRHGGALPGDAKQLRTLPGIGDYTAGAIASIAYGLPEPAVDGNVLRVFMRLTARKGNIMSTSVRKDVASLLRQVYPVGADAAHLTEGIMELGERVCIPNGEPRCERCPVAHLCRAAAQNRQDEYPVKPEKKARRIEPKTVLLLCCNGELALERRPENGLLAGLWQFPLLDGTLTPDAVRAWLTEQGMESLDIVPCGEAIHIFSHVEWHMTGYRVALKNKTPAYTWCTPDALQAVYAIPTAYKYYVNLISAD